MKSKLSGNAFFIVTLLVIPYLLSASILAEDSDLVVCNTIPGELIGDGKTKDLLREYFAKKSDRDASWAWKPEDKKLAPLSEIIAKAKTVIPKPGRSDQIKYLPPKVVGVDLRMFEPGLWYWEVHVAFDIDHDSNRKINIRDGTIYQSAIFLANGGAVTIKERKMTGKERIQYFVDPDPKAKDPFAVPD